MGQKLISDDLIIYCLGDYTHFICDQFGIPHDRADGLLQQYLDRTVQGSPPQLARSPYEESTKYPEILDFHPNIPYQEQPQSSTLASDLCNFPLSYEAPSSPQCVSYIEEADHSFHVPDLTAPDAKSQRLFLHNDQKSADMMTTDSDLSGNNPISTQSRETSDGSPIGSIRDYNPLWVQHNNIDHSEVENFRSPMKFDTLFTNRIITLGDSLTFKVSASTDGHVRMTEAHLKVRRQRHPKETLIMLIK